MSSHNPFEFELNVQAEIIVSGEKGIIIGRAAYAVGENCYLLRYRANDGRAVENWWNQSALYPIDKSDKPTP
jgi:hypothetical protein